MKLMVQRYNLLKKPCELDGYLKLKTAPVHPVEPTKEEVKKLLERANSCLCTYTPSETKLRVDAKLIKGICKLILK